MVLKADVSSSHSSEVKVFFEALLSVLVVIMVSLSFMSHDVGRCRFVAYNRGKDTIKIIVNPNKHQTIQVASCLLRETKRSRVLEPFGSQHSIQLFFWFPERS